MCVSADVYKCVCVCENLHIRCGLAALFQPEKNKTVLIKLLSSEFCRFLVLLIFYIKQSGMGGERLKEKHTHTHTTCAVPVSGYFTFLPFN